MRHEANSKKLVDSTAQNWNLFCTHFFWVGLAGLLLSLMVCVMAIPQVLRSLTPTSQGFVCLNTRKEYWADQTPTEAEKDFIMLCMRVAEGRCHELYGSLTSRPRCIFLYKPYNVERFMPNAPTRIASTFYFGQSFIVFSMYELSAAIASHELCHAELYDRLGKGLRQPQLPQWFDEGLALLLDERYAESEKWLRAYTSEQPRPQDLASRTNFYANPQTNSLRNHLLAREWVRTWYERNGQQGLLKFIEAMRAGQSFEESYGTH